MAALSTVCPRAGCHASQPPLWPGAPSHSLAVSGPNRPIEESTVAPAIICAQCGLAFTWARGKAKAVSSGPSAAILPPTPCGQELLRMDHGALRSVAQRLNLSIPATRSETLAIIQAHLLRLYGIEPATHPDQAGPEE